MAYLAEVIDENGLADHIRYGHRVTEAAWSSDRKKKNQANSNWRYDSNKHKRNKYKDQRYKYYYGGFWYLEPYWTGPGYGYRVGCNEGRDIVRENGFRRVQVMECEGRNYTYAGSRRGVPFRIVLNSRSGDIVSARPM